jgi:hypothetical protein
MMEKDKLAWMRRPIDGHASGVVRSARSDGRVDALDAALRAQLMHVAIGLTKDRDRPIKMLIDLCVYVSMTKPKSSSYLEAARAIVLIEAKNRSKASHHYKNYHIETMAKHMLITTDFCTSSPADYRAYAPRTVGEPVTLQILFDTNSEQNAQIEANALCDRLSHWGGKETTLPTAVKRIQDAIVERASAGANSADLLYRTAFIKAGWKPQVDDTANLLWCVAVRERASHKLPAVFREFCYHRLEETWSDTARHTGLFDIEALADKIDDRDDDIADDFVDAEKLMAAVFGDRPIRKLR